MYPISITPEEIAQLPRAAFTGTIVVIDKLDERFDAAIRYLRRQKVIGFDTESRPTFSPDQPHYGTSLLQLSGPEKAFLFRIKYIGMPEKLCAILSHPDIVKVGAAVTDDIHGLQKFRGFNPNGFVDLQKIGWEYGIREKGVKKMAGIVLGVRISKNQQLSNWEADRLSQPQRLYAATDAWVCREMYLKLQQSEKHPLTLEEFDPEKAEALKRAAERAKRAEEEARRAAERRAAGKGPSRSARRRAARRRRKAAAAAQKAAQEKEL